jgi:hypothetical protein
MAKFGKGLGNRGGLARGFSHAIRQKLESDRGGHGSRKNRGIGDNLTRSITNDIVAPGNSRPGRELSRRGWGTNLAGMVSQELSNDLVRGSHSKAKRRGR